MAEVTGLDGFTPEEQAEIAQLPEDHPLVKALRSTRFELKAEKVKGRIAGLQAQYPQLGLTQEDFEGLKPDQFESRVQRLATLAGTVAAPKSPETERAESTVLPSEDAFQRMAQPIDAAPPVSGEKKISVDQAFALYKKNPSEFERVKAAGLIENWPSADDKGGAIRFS